MTTEIEDDDGFEDAEFDPDDPFGLKNPGVGRRTSLGKLARENAVVRRRGEYGDLDEDRVDEEKPGFRPGTFYRPFS